MKQQDQLQKVFTFLSKPFEFAKQAQIYFKTTVCPDQVPFRFRALLSKLLLLNLLTTSQRIICLFFLLGTPLQESEFISTMIFILEKGEHSYESLMIYDCWFKNNKKKYQNMKIKQMVEDYETDVVVIKQSVKSQINTLLEKLKSIQNQISQSIKSHISPQVIEYQTVHAIDQPLNQTQFNQLDLYTNSFSSNMMRPIPSFVPIDSSEFIWLSPGPVGDIKYDFSGQFLQLYNTGESVTLSKTQKSLFEQLLPTQISLILTNSEYFIDKFTSFFSFNPHMAYLILQLIHSEKVSEYFYDKLINIEVSKSTLETMKKLIFNQDVPKMTINYYIIKTMSKCQQQQQSQQEGLARMIVALLREIIKAKKIDIKDIEQQIRSFGIKFSHIEQVAKFYKIVVQNHS